METCDKCGPGTEAQVSFMTPEGPIILCRHHARKFATALRAYPSAPVVRASGPRPSSGTKPRPAWRGVMWPPA
jgi:hypothetical protein